MRARACVCVSQTASALRERCCTDEYMATFLTLYPTELWGKRRKKTCPNILVGVLDLLRNLASGALCNDEDRRASRQFVRASAVGGAPYTRCCCCKEEERGEVHRFGYSRINPDKSSNGNLFLNFERRDNPNSKPGGGAHFKTLIIHRSRSGGIKGIARGRIFLSI